MPAGSSVSGGWVRLSESDGIGALWACCRGVAGGRVRFTTRLRYGNGNMLAFCRRLPLFVGYA